jgi:hypothetical protein
MGVRKVVNNRFKSIFLFPSIKLRRQVWADSPLEHDYIHLLEPDSEVSYYEGQPLKICYTLTGEKRVRTYTPDFLVKRGDKIQIVEVKLKKNTLDERIQLLFRIATRACLLKGCEFVVATEETIRLQPRLDNLKTCWRYASTPVSPPRYRFYCREFFSSEAVAPLGEVIRYFESKNVSRRVVYALLYWGVLAVNFMKPLDRDSLVSFPSLAALKEVGDGR